MRVILLAILIFPAFLFAQEDLEVLSQGYSSMPASGIGLMRGQFRPVNFTLLSAGIDGKLSKFDVRAGSIVKKGNAIAHFACEQERAENQIAKAREMAAQKKLEVDNKLAGYQNVSELELAMSQAEVEIASAEADRSNAVLKECTITAPFNATVTEKFIQAHQYVQKGEPLVELVGIDELEIEMVLPSLDVNNYTKGRGFSIVVDETGLQYEAEIDRVVSVVDPVSQTIRVIGRLSGSSEGLMPGMSGVVEFE